MLHFGLTGYPLEHSLSPRLHTAALQALGMEGEYSLYPVPPIPEGESQLAELLERVRGGGLHGLNVTIPHKQSVLSRLDRLTPEAEAVGAVNTIYFRDGSLTGDNTDAAGFWADLQRAASNILETPQSALVLGAGGSARAVIYALLKNDWRVYVAARRIEQAEELCNSLSGMAAGESSGLEASAGSRDHQEDRLKPRVLGNDGSGVEASAGSREDPKDRLNPRVHVMGSAVPIRLDAASISNLRLYSTAQSPVVLNRTLTLIINTTPLGMSPNTEASPWPQGIPFPPQAVVYDLVYNPLETALLRSARQAGRPAFSGLGMLVEQAALAFQRWTGLAAPREAMRQSVKYLEHPEKS